VTTAVLIGTSLDGFIARADGALDFLPPGGGEPHGYLATPPPGAVVERMAGAPADIVSQLAARGVKHIYMDGGITIQRFLRAGLIQRLIITRVPVLIGSGIPLFGSLDQDVPVTHVATQDVGAQRDDYGHDRPSGPVRSGVQHPSEQVVERP
jgi:hypothetical protein